MRVQYLLFTGAGGAAGAPPGGGGGGGAGGADDEVSGAAAGVAGVSVDAGVLEAGAVTDSRPGIDPS